MSGIVSMTNSSPAEVAAELRMSALTVFPAQIAKDPRYKDSPALGVIMETGYDKAVVTLSCSIAGDASLYFSSGGGIIGGAGHAEVRIAARRFTQFAGVHIPEMLRCTDYPLPKIGQTTFYITTADGIFTLTALEQELGGGTLDFSPLFHAGHYVIAQLRMTTEKK
jgi:hypothetical protein